VKYSILLIVLIVKERLKELKITIIFIDSYSSKSVPEILDRRVALEDVFFSWIVRHTVFTLIFQSPATGPGVSRDRG
jgi:hypothetical protein